MDQPDDNEAALLCAYCFNDRGLRRMALYCQQEERVCPNCGVKSHSVMTFSQLLYLCELFFVKGSTRPSFYGRAPAIQFNQHQKGSLNPNPSLAQDVELLQSVLGIGFFHYGPRLWMLGHIGPLEDLQNEETRSSVITQILNLYPTVQLNKKDEFYRVRKKVNQDARLDPSNPDEYDAPPDGFYGDGRLDSPNRPIFYASQDADICVHECRFMAADELYIATLRPTRPLNLLDLSSVLDEPDKDEFKSLDLAVLMLFLAGPHAYPITREISMAVEKHGFDGLIYPSYFSVLRTGRDPFQTVYGLSLRHYLNEKDYERSKIIGNLALFGRPIADRKIEAIGINSLIIHQVNYEMILGPVTY